LFTKEALIGVTPYGRLHLLRRPKFRVLQKVIFPQPIDLIRLMEDAYSVKMRLIPLREFVAADFMKHAVPSLPNGMYRSILRFQQKKWTLNFLAQ